MARITKTQLVRLQKKLKTDAAIGREFGITRQAVHQMRRKYNIPSNLIQNPDRNEKIYNEYKEGVLVTKLIKKYKISVSQTYRIINNAKSEELKAKRKRKRMEAKKNVSRSKVAQKKIQAKKPVRKTIKATATSETP